MKITPIAIAIFLCGAFSGYKFNLIGEIYAAEFMLLPVAMAGIFFGRSSALLREKIFWLMIFSMLVTISGYMISDLVQDTLPEQYLRGWGRVALMVSDFLAMAVLAAHDKRTLWWFVLGIGLGGVAQLQLDHIPITMWKFGYGVPVILSVIALGHFLPVKVTSMLLAILGAVNLGLDFRIMAAVSLLMSALLWARSRRPAHAMRGAVVIRAVLPVGMAGILLLAGLGMTEEGNLARREQSNLGRSVGIEVGLHAVEASPLIGYGSWNSSKELDNMQSEAFSKEGMAGNGSAAGGRHFSPHSQVLQAWMEGGVLGAAFFLVYGYQLLKASRHVALVRAMDSYTPIFLFFILFGLWDLLMSPFAAPHRIHIAFAAAVLCAIAIEKNSGGKTKP